jgi:hypothetical protein
VSTGPIQPIERDRVEQRQDVKLPTAWIGLEHPPPDTSQGQWLTQDNTSPPATAHADTPVLIMFAAPAGPAFEALLAQGQAGARVYVLAPAGWEPKDSAIVRCPKVLIRRLPEVPASAVHTASGADLWMGAEHTGAAPWRLRLVPDQASAFRQAFLRLFWHEATDEAYSGGIRLTFRAAGTRPFDVPELTAAASVRLVAPTAQTGPDNGEGALVHCTSSSPPEGQPNHLWLSPSGDHHGRLAKLVRSGARVQWRDRSLPDLTIQGASGTALLPGTRYRMQIELTQDQASDVADLLQQTGSWSFQETIRLGDHAHDGSTIWLKGAGVAHPVEPEQGIDLPEVGADSLRAMAASTPSSWPPPQPLALTAQYRWTVVPPRVPASASEDPLIGRWQKADKDWVSRIGKARAALEAAEGSRGRISRVFSGLMSAMMGFERTQSGLLADVAMLDALQPSEVGPEDAPAIFTRLESLEDQTKKLESDLDEAEHKAREDEEREKQETQWRQRAEEAQRELPEHRSDLKELEAGRPTLDEQLAALSDELKSAGKKAKRSLSARRAKLNDERTRLDRKIQRLSDEICAFERSTAEPFIFVPPTRPTMRSKGSGGRFVPASSAARPSSTVPGEALPEVGSLRVHKSKRYLVIDRWEDLDLGEQDASRLKALLVAPEDI